MNKRLDSLQVLRAIAAILVVFTHAQRRVFYYYDQADLPIPPPP